MSNENATCWPSMALVAVLISESELYPEICIQTYTEIQKWNQSASVFFFSLAFFRSKDFRWALNKDYEAFQSNSLKLLISDTGRNSKGLRSFVLRAQRPTCSSRIRDQHGQLYPVMVHSCQLTANTRHQEFTETERQNNSNDFFIFSKDRQLPVACNQGQLRHNNLLSLRVYI